MLDPEDRDIAMVFQILCPISAYDGGQDNMGFSLELTDGSSKPTKFLKAKVELGRGHSGPCDKLLDRYPRQLSGGQRQRVAMGRAHCAQSTGVPVR